MDNFTLNGEDGQGFNEGVFVSAYDLPPHVTRGLSTLPSQFIDSEKLRALLQIFLEEIEELSLVIMELKRQQDYEYAVGAQLDVIGERLGYVRPFGYSDEHYRSHLKLKILSNNSTGTQPYIYSMLKEAVGTNNIEIIPEYPAGFLFITDTTPPLDGRMNIVAEALPIAVRMSTSTPYSTNDRFCFFGGSGKGFSSVGYPAGTGGEFRGRKNYS